MRAKGPLAAAPAMRMRVYTWTKPCFVFQKKPCFCPWSAAGVFEVIRCGWKEAMLGGVGVAGEGRWPKCLGGQKKQGAFR